MKHAALYLAFAAVVGVIGWLSLAFLNAGHPWMAFWFALLTIGGIRIKTDDLDTKPAARRLAGEET